MADPLDDLPEFEAAVRRRLEQGRARYGDQSFSRSVVDLVGELEQEALDLAGWGFVLWTRLREMRRSASVALGCPRCGEDASAMRCVTCGAFGADGPDAASAGCDALYAPGPNCTPVRCSRAAGHSPPHVHEGVVW